MNAKSSSPAPSDPFTAVAQHFGFENGAELRTVQTFLRIKGVELGKSEELTLVVLGGFFMRAGLSETARMLILGELADHDRRQLAVDVVAIFDGVFATATRRHGSEHWDLRSGETIKDPIAGGHKPLMATLFYVGTYYSTVREVLNG